MAQLRVSVFKTLIDYIKKQLVWMVKFSYLNLITHGGDDMICLLHIENTLKKKRQQSRSMHANMQSNRSLNYTEDTTLT